MNSSGFRIKIILLAWLAVIGFDFFLHGGILARFYSESNGFLLPSEEAFRLIPLGYVSFLLFVVLLGWLMPRFGIEGWQPGLYFGLKAGVLMGGSLALGLISITTVSVTFIIAWSSGQIIEFGIAGAVLGSGLAAVGLRPLGIKVAVFFVIMFGLGVIIQNVIT